MCVYTRVCVSLSVYTCACVCEVYESECISVGVHTCVSVCMCMLVCTCTHAHTAAEVQLQRQMRGRGQKLKAAQLLGRQGKVWRRRRGSWLGAGWGLGSSRLLLPSVAPRPCNSLPLSFQATRVGQLPGGCDRPGGHLRGGVVRAQPWMRGPWGWEEGSVPGGR